MKEISEIGKKGILEKCSVERVWLCSSGAETVGYLHIDAYKGGGGMAMVRACRHMVHLRVSQRFCFMMNVVMISLLV